MAATFAVAAAAGSVVTSESPAATIARLNALRPPYVTTQRTLARGDGVINQLMACGECVVASATASWCRQVCAAREHFARDSFRQLTLNGAVESCATYSAPQALTPR